MLSLVYLILIQIVECQMKNDYNEMHFKRCHFPNDTVTPLSCTNQPMNVKTMSSKVKCSVYCAYLSLGRNITFDDQSPSPFYPFQYTDNGTNIFYNNYSFPLQRAPGRRLLAGQTQTCVGFNYQQSSGLCQLFDGPCLKSNITRIGNVDLGVYHAYVSKSNSSCYLGEYEDCTDIPYKDQNSSGVYLVQIDNQTRPIYCHIFNDSVKYMVIQKRMDGSVDFYRGWNDYEYGFGNISGEYYIGNYMLYRLTTKRNYTLRVELESFDGVKVYAEYLEFIVGPPSTMYTLTISGCNNGTAGDSMNYHNGQKFTTFDNDNDPCTCNCAVVLKSAGWYDWCYRANVNGGYKGPIPLPAIGIVWNTFRGLSEQLKTCQMLITYK